MSRLACLFGPAPRDRSGSSRAHRRLHMLDRHSAFVVGGMLLVGLSMVAAQQTASPTGYTDTPMQPNGKWRIHDGTRPQPRVVTPGDPVASGNSRISGG